MTEEDVEASTDGFMKLYTMDYIDEERRCFAFTDHEYVMHNNPVAGVPYLLQMISGQFQAIAHDTQVLKEPVADDINLRVLSYNTGTVAGTFSGTFRRISNEDAANRLLYTLNSGKWCRIRDDEARYRNAWVGAFRAFYAPEVEPEYNTYKTYYIAEPQGGFGTGGTIYVSFPSPYWATDTDFTGYDFDDEETGIEGLSPDPSPVREGRVGVWYTLDGRKIANGQKPTAKGLYIINGKKIIVK